MGKTKEITKISDLLPDANNYNKGTEFGTGLIEKSIRKNGLGRSVLADKYGRLIAGNKATEGTVAAGFGDDDIIVVKTDGTKLVVVQRTDLDLDTKRGRELALADNATAKANLSWDYDKLGADFETPELEAWGVFADESAGGFGDNSLNSEAQEDNFEAPEIETVKTDIVLGDLFEIGPHRLLCGDSTKAEEVERLMGGEKADVCLTDPPYGVNMDKGFGGFVGFGGLGKPIARRVYADKWDSSIPDRSAFDLIFKSSKNAIVFGGNFFAHILPQSTHWIFWDKLQTMPTFGDGELAWTNFDRKSVNKVTVQYNGLIGKEETRYHPTQKPVKLFLEILAEYLKSGEMVCDFFIGSGTTMVATHQLGRRCYAMEISEKYCQIIIDRMLKLDPTLEIKKNGQPYVGITY